MQVFKYSGPEFSPYGDEQRETLTDQGPWRAPSASAPLNAVLSLPGSKSLTNRELVLSALASGPSLLKRPLHSRDTALMIEALRSLGVGIEEVPGDGDFGPDLVITPGELTGGTSIDCGLAGTVMRFLPPVAALGLGPITFDGDAHARTRPMRTTIDSLRALGVDVNDDGLGRLPFSLYGTGAVVGGEIEIDASSSSQFVSGLLLSAARFEKGLTLRHVGDTVPSGAHIAMTIACLAARGVTVENPEPGVWVVPHTEIRGIEVEIEPDLSNAAPFLGAALVAGGSVTITGWPTNTTQVGDELASILAEMGGVVTRDDDSLTVTGNGTITGITLDNASELAPNLAAIAALANSETVLTGIAHLRGHETDRLAALVAEIGALGGDATETDDGLVIRPVQLHAGQWRSYADHRMATAGALIGLAVPGVEIDDIATTAKTLPQFVELWTAMLGRQPE
jgi:3-phosphoshikimate 1-carboxyvinyltransferase